MIEEKHKADIKSEAKLKTKQDVIPKIQSKAKAESDRKVAVPSKESSHLSQSGSIVLLPGFKSTVTRKSFNRAKSVLGPNEKPKIELRSDWMIVSHLFLNWKSIWYSLG